VTAHKKADPVAAMELILMVGNELFQRPGVIEGSRIETPGKKSSKQMAFFSLVG
jgi:hypothetical protein